MESVINDDFDCIFDSFYILLLSTLFYDLYLLVCGVGNVVHSELTGVDYSDTCYFGVKFMDQYQYLLLMMS